MKSKQIKFVDLNHYLVNKVKKLGIDSTQGDYFLEAYRTPRFVLITASNPFWGFGAGIDAQFKKHFPLLCEYKRQKGGENERIGNICFTISVDEELKSSKEKVGEAIKFALDNTDDRETLILSGIGTGIGKNANFSDDDFISVLEEVLKLNK